jgi:hypothetical protein
MRDEPLEWLLESSDPGVRYLALRDLVDKPEDDELKEARQRAYQEGPISSVLNKMQPEGYWVKPGPGYLPKYRSTVWALILLAQLGARVEEDSRINQACEYLLEHALGAGGQFGIHGTPSSTIDCLQGNLCWVLLEMGYADPRLDQAFEWMARTVTGEGIAPKKIKMLNAGITPTSAGQTSLAARMAPRHAPGEQPKLCWHSGSYPQSIVLA